MSSVVDRRALEQQARRALESGDFERALRSLWALADQKHIPEEDFRSAAASMAHAYAALGRGRAASMLALYLGDHATAARLAVGPLDRARIFRTRAQSMEAAQEFEQAGFLGHAAILAENAGNDRAARVLWERLASSGRLGADPYIAGLVHFNAGRAAQRLGDRTAGRRSIVHAMHLLTAAADGFEAQGLRERAFDCYGVLLTIGREGSFENLVEGYLNCIRILREDGLRYYVLQYFEDVQKEALARGELHAAATLFREASDYARRQGLPYDRIYRFRGAETSVEHAQQLLRAGASHEMAENAYAAAVDGFNELGVYSKVRELYLRLASLELGDKRVARYRRLAERLAAMPDATAPMASFPDYLRMPSAYPDVWRLDVIEWEQGGDPAETMLDVALDRRVGELQRRRAILCAVAQLGAGDPPYAPPTLVQAAELLGSVELYVCLAPLERLARDEDVRVRIAAQRAARRLYYKRTFVTVARGLADAAPEVRREALACVEELHFAHALDPLSRIHRESSDPLVRRAALGSIGRIQRVEAVEFLLEALRHGAPDERAVARERLAAHESPDALALLRREASFETGPLREELDRLVRARER